MMCPPLPWGGWDGCGPTVEGRVNSNVQRQRQSPRQLQYSIAIINIIAIMSMIASPPSWPSSPHRHHGHHRLIATMAIIASSPPWPSSPHTLVAITAPSPSAYQRFIASIASIASIAIIVIIAKTCLQTRTWP